MKVSVLFDGLILLLLVFLLAVSMDYPLKLKLLPWILICLAIVFAGCQIGIDLKGTEEGEGKKGGLTMAAWITILKGTGRGYLKALLWILALFVSLYLIGFLITIPLFTIFYLKTHGEKWRFAVGLSVILWGIFFATFILGLKVSLFKGQLFLLLFS